MPNPLEEPPARDKGDYFAPPSALQRDVKPTDRVPVPPLPNDGGLLSLPDIKITGTEKPKSALKENYSTAEANQAATDALKENKPLVVHIGAEWCGPCRIMLKNVWPTVEKEMAGKAAFLHIDGDQAKKGIGGKFAKQLVDSVESYPTIVILRPEKSQNGKISLTETGRNPEAMNLVQTRKFLEKIK